MALPRLGSRGSVIARTGGSPAWRALPATPERSPRRVGTAPVRIGGDADAAVRTLAVADVMNPEIPEVPPDIPATAAVQIMLDRGIREIYLMHHGGGASWPAAVLRYGDVLRYLSAESEADVADLGAGAPRPSPIEAFAERYKLKS